LGSEAPATSIPRNSSDTTSGGDVTTSTTSTSACETGASWGARGDFVIESRGAGNAFADAVNALVDASDTPPVAVMSHIDPGCVWKVAFTAPQSNGAWSTEHPSTFAPMLRHPAGLWTAAPQSTGWLRIVDRSSRPVWIPITDVTGSATYAEASCASLSAVRVSATIPLSAATLHLTTPAGERTLRDLMGTEPAANGWTVRFTFSADTAR